MHAYSRSEVFCSMSQLKSLNFTRLLSTSRPRSTPRWQQTGDENGSEWKQSPDKEGEKYPPAICVPGTIDSTMQHDLSSTFQTFSSVFPVFRTPQNIISPLLLRGCCSASIPEQVYFKKMLSLPIFSFPLPNLQTISTLRTSIENFKR